MLEISFPDSTAAEANILVRGLRTQLADIGFPPDGISPRRTNSENMVDTDMLRLALDALAVVGGHTFAESLFLFAKRRRRGIRITMPYGQFDIRPDKEDPAQIADFLRRLAGLLHGPSDK